MKETFDNLKKVYNYGKKYKVVGEGTHKQLLSKNKIYKKLYENEILNQK